jgi:phosphoribosylanthranilate isomerase
MSTRVKICGITRPEDAVLAGKLGAWAIGMIFAPSSPRCLSLEQAERVAQVVPEGVLKVGVFMDQGEDEIRAAQRALGLDLVQLHGAETDLFSRLIGKSRVMKAVVLRSQSSIDEVARREAAYLLVDRPRHIPSGGTVDWKWAAELAHKVPQMLLAGALNASNVDAAVAQVRPWGVDVASGVESAPGVKDRDKLTDFFAAVRRGDAHE